MRKNLDLASECLRDRFAMAALPFALEALQYEFGAKDPEAHSVGNMAHKAYELADAMLIARTPPVAPKETDVDPHS